MNCTRYHCQSAKPDWFTDISARTPRDTIQSRVATHSRTAYQLHEAGLALAIELQQGSSDPSPIHHCSSTGTCSAHALSNPVLVPIA